VKTGSRDAAGIDEAGPAIEVSAIVRGRDTVSAVPIAIDDLR